MKRLETVRNGGCSGTLVTQKRSGKVRNVGQSETSAKSRSQLLLEQRSPFNIEGSVTSEKLSVD